MRVAIMGGTGTGKTTLSRALAHRCSLPLLEEKLAPVIIAAGALDQCVLDKDQRRLGKALQDYHQATVSWLRQRHEFQKENSSYVMDRCCFDSLNAWISLLSKMDNTKQESLQSLIRMCQKHSQLIDMIVVLPIMKFSLTPSQNEDGLQRQTGLAKKIEHQANILGVLQLFCRKPVLLIPSNIESLEKRVEYVIEFRERLNHSRKVQPAS